MEKSLYEQLTEYGQSDMYPFHMPGHKRNPVISYIPNNIDITEIDGFDNLHHAEGILKAAKERAADFYGAKKSWYLINGSTSGLLIAVSAVANNSGGTLVMARNCHKAAYHAAFLNRMKIKYLYPARQKRGYSSLNGSISPAQVEDALENASDVKAVVITSPTYDGIVSDISAIAYICHKKGVPLIVDEAHGAHFVLYEKFTSDSEKNNMPRSALYQGADIVIHSLHKTLPSMTQTALMHLQGDLVSWEMLEKYSGIYQSSSPSYVMMAGMDSCIRFLEEQGHDYSEKFIWNLRQFYDKVKNLNYIKVYINNECSTEIFAKDFSKILIFCSGLKELGTGRKIDGQWLYERLLNKYHLQMEMSAADYVLALTSIMDREEGFRRLYEALCEIDKEVMEVGSNDLPDDFSINVPECVFEIYDTVGRSVRKVAFRESAGMVSNEFVYLYPPGCPLIVPGERISPSLVSQIEFYKSLNFNIEGLMDKSSENIEILYEEN